MTFINLLIDYITIMEIIIVSYILIVDRNGFELNKKNNEIVKKLKTDEGLVSYDSSISRTKREIREICLCNNFDYFFTLTVNSKLCDRFSLENCQDNLKRLLHNYSRICKRAGNKFSYIIITEKHKDGAFHFHGLCSGVCDLFTNEYGYLSSSYFNKYLGFCSFSLIKSLDSVSNYILKYISKDTVKNSTNQIYFCSRGLLRAGVFDLPARRSRKKTEN